MDINISNLSEMTFDELLKFIENDCLTGKWFVVNRLMSVCENYDQAKRAYLVTEKFCPEPSFGLLELMLSYADRKQILEILEIIENDNDNFEFLNNRAIDKYEDLCSKILNEKPYGRYLPSYGFPLLGELYNDSTMSPCIRRDAFQMIMKAVVEMVENHEASIHRLRSFINLNINDEPEFIEIKEKFQKWIKVNVKNC